MAREIVLRQGLREMLGLTSTTESRWQSLP